MELMNALGIDWKLLIIQIVNFGILFFFLKHLLYKPLLNLLEQREEKARENILLSNALNEQRDELTKTKDDILKSAQEEVRKILIEARALSEKEHSKMIKIAEDRAEDLIKRAEESAKLEKDNIIKEVKKEMSDLIILATQKILVTKLDQASDKVLIEKMIDEVKGKL